MKLFKDIEQKTEAWFKIKHGKIGGSTSKGLLVKGDTLLIQMLSERCEDFEMDADSYESNDMQRGNELEPVGIRELEIYTNENFEEIGWVEHETIKILGISPDGLSKNGFVACELKCPSAKKHTENIRNNVVPLDHIHQCIQYFVVIDTLKELHFASFRPENNFKPLFVKTINRDSVVNIGTKARPVEKTIQECVEMYESKAKELEAQLEKEVESIKF